MPAKQKGVSKVLKGSSEESKKTPPPNWPVFEPQTPLEDLSLCELYPEQIVTIPGLWTATLCKKYVRFLSNLPLVTTPGTPKRGDAVRVNDRFQIDDAAFAERLWSETGLKDLILAQGDSGAVREAPVETQNDVQARWGGTPIGLNPNIRIYRYVKGQFFDQHCKCCDWW